MLQVQDLDEVEKNCEGMWIENLRQAGTDDNVSLASDETASQ